MEQGADDYLVKPFHDQELLIAVENCLTAKKLLPKPDELAIEPAE